MSEQETYHTAQYLGKASKDRFAPVRQAQNTIVDLDHINFKNGVLTREFSNPLHMNAGDVYKITTFLPAEDAVEEYIIMTNAGVRAQEKFDVQAFVQIMNDADPKPQDLTL